MQVMNKKIVLRVIAIMLAASVSWLQLAQAEVVKHSAQKSTATKKGTLAPPAASSEQLAAAQQVYYGVYDCEFNQKISVTAHPTHAAYVDVKHGKMTYLMKPVASPTGATRLEDLKGEMLLVQIANKSMLMNVKRGQRVVDGCTNPQQRELVDAMKTSSNHLTHHSLDV
jgi:hypothetical protein